MTASDLELGLPGLTTEGQSVYEEIDLRDSDAGQIVANILNASGNEDLNWNFDQDDVDMYMSDGRVIPTTRHKLKIYLTHKITMGQMENPTVRGWTDWSYSALADVECMSRKDIDDHFKHIGADKDYSQFQRFLYFVIRDVTEHSEDLLTPQLYQHLYTTELASALNIPKDNFTDYRTFLQIYKERVEDENFWTKNEEGDFEDDGL